MVTSMYPDALTRIDRNGPSGCWLWTGSVQSASSYGRYWISRTKPDGGRHIQAHRAVWETLKGPIPEGLQLDHLCRNTMCVNPDHLEPVTDKENKNRSDFDGWGTYWRNRDACSHGHAYTAENTSITPRGHRVCRACHRRNSAISRARVRDRGK